MLDRRARGIRAAIMVGGCVLAGLAYPLMVRVLEVGAPQGMSAPAAAQTASIAVLLAAYLTAWRHWGRAGFRRTRGRAALALSSATTLALLVNVAVNIGGIAPRSAPSIAAIVCFVALVGFVEEVIFRGLVGRLLLRRRGLWIALVVSAAIFGAMHSVNAVGGGQSATDTALQVTIAGVFGVLFGAMYFATGSIWPVIVLHAAYDGLQLLGVHQTSGLARVVNIVIMALGSAALIWYLWRGDADPRFQRNTSKTVTPRPEAGVRSAD